MGYGDNFGDSDRFGSRFDRDRRGGRGGRGRGRGGGRGGRGGRGFGRDDYDRDNNRRDREDSPPDHTIDELFAAQQQTGINFDKYESIPVEVEGDNVPEPMNTFPEMELQPSLAKNILRCGYGKPTPVQKYSFPICRASRDLMSCAQTGSGKTAGFLLPLINRILKEQIEVNAPRPAEPANPISLVLSPTRELASQIQDECRKFTDRTSIRSVAVYGGRDMQKQLRGVRSGCHIVIGTPGRIIDMIQRGYLGLEKIQYLVLDEADCMLDMGFEPQIREIIESFNMPPPSDRQTLMFSATFPKEIQRLARSFLKKDYVYLTVGRVGAAAETVEQNFLHIEEMDKMRELVNVLSNVETDRTKALVFVKRKVDVDEIVRELNNAGIRALSIHGDKNQQQRERALRRFKNGEASVLVATDVAARGLDIRGVEHVVNYDMPQNMDSYVHRIGRTGRVGNSGRATTFFNKLDAGISKDLVKECEKNNVEVPDFIRQMAFYRNGSRYGGRSGGRGGGYGRSRGGNYRNSGYGGRGGDGREYGRGGGFGSSRFNPF